MADLAAGSPLPSQTVCCQNRMHHRIGCQSTCKNRGKHRGRYITGRPTKTNIWNQRHMHVFCKNNPLRCGCRCRHEKCLHGIPQVAGNSMRTMLLCSLLHVANSQPMDGLCFELHPTAYVQQNLLPTIIKTSRS